MKHLIYLLLPILSIGINSCNVAHENDHAHENESNDKHQLNEITLHPEEAERFGVETSIVETRNFNASLKVSGEIYPSKKAQYTISATKSGIIHFNDGINLGTAVSDGTPVASISANQIIGGDDEQKAKITLENAKQEYERISALYNEKIVTEQDFLIAKENYLQALNAYKPQAETMISALSGIITAIYVNEGDWGSARELWIHVYNRQKKGNAKFRAAYNVALSYEMTGDMDNAEEWLKKASDCVKSGSEEEMVLKYYMSQFVKRKVEFGKLNIQMGRFNNNF